MTIFRENYINVLVTHFIYTVLNVQYLDINYSRS